MAATTIRRSLAFRQTSALAWHTEMAATTIRRSVAFRPIARLDKMKKLTEEGRVGCGGFGQRIGQRKGRRKTNEKGSEKAEERQKKKMVGTALCYKMGWEGHVRMILNKWPEGR